MTQPSEAERTEVASPPRYPVLTYNIRISYAMKDALKFNDTQICKLNNENKTQIVPPK